MTLASGREYLQINTAFFLHHLHVFWKALAGERILICIILMMSVHKRALCKLGLQQVAFCAVTNVTTLSKPALIFSVFSKEHSTKKTKNSTSRGIPRMLYFLATQTALPGLFGIEHFCSLSWDGNRY